MGKIGMTVFKIFIVVTVLLLCSSLGAGYNCTRRYHRLLREVGVVKANCPNAAFHDCCQIQNISLALSSGQYEIGDVCGVHSFGNYGKMKVRCDLETDRGGWIVIQRRVPNSTVNFYRGWKDYEEGFGDLDDEFWYGLRNIHCLTTRENMTLRIDLQDEQGNKLTWVYEEFSVDGPEQKYRLHIGQGTGTPPGSYDAMAGSYSLNDVYFTTFDRDNDDWGSNCAVDRRAAWWYRSCTYSNLNGPHTGRSGWRSLMWYSGSAIVYYPSVEMKVRPKTCEYSQQCSQ